MAQGNNSSSVHTLHSAETELVWQVSSRKAPRDPQPPVFTPWGSLRRVRIGLHDR